MMTCVSTQRPQRFHAPHCCQWDSLPNISMQISKFSTASSFVDKQTLRHTLARTVVHHALMTASLCSAMDKSISETRHQYIDNGVSSSLVDEDISYLFVLCGYPRALSIDLQFSNLKPHIAYLLRLFMHLSVTYFQYRSWDKEPTA